MIGDIYKVVVSAYGTSYIPNMTSNGESHDEETLMSALQRSMLVLMLTNRCYMKSKLMVVQLALS